MQRIPANDIIINIWTCQKQQMKRFEETYARPRQIRDNVAVLIEGQVDLEETALASLQRYLHRGRNFRDFENLLATNLYMFSIRVGVRFRKRLAIIKNGSKFGDVRSRS